MRHALLLLALAFSLGATAVAAPSAAELAQATLVVYNSAAPDSAKLARFYAAQRHIAKDHVVGLKCSTEEEISRQEYDDTIANPLRKIFAEHKWWSLINANGARPVVTSNQIDFVALIRGMPLKIRFTATYVGDQSANNPIGSQNQASVDSELSLLGLFSRQISGASPNPYFGASGPISELGASPLMLVCRLDAPTAAIVKRMIVDSVETETTGLWGRAYVDGANRSGGGLGDGDIWLKTVVKDLRHVGIPVVYDQKAETFPAGFPMDDCALYYGWYASNVNGPFTDPGFAFRRGAIAVHIHSFSANTLRRTDANWVGPLLSKGAAASLGNVYEPYLELTAHLDIFNDRLLHGFTLAESAYMATRGLSWMTVVVGDPLYRPYLSWQQTGVKAHAAKGSDWEMYHDFALKHSSEAAEEYMAEARPAAARAANGPMIEDLGLMQKEAGDFSDAISCLRQARTIYKQRGDLLRVGIEQADALIQADRKKDALKLVRETLRMIPNTPSSALLQKIEAQLSPPTPTPRPAFTP